MADSYLAEPDPELGGLQVHAQHEVLRRLALVVHGAGGACVGGREQAEASPKLPERQELREALLVRPHHGQDLRASQLQHRSENHDDCHHLSIPRAPRARGIGGQGRRVGEIMVPSPSVNAGQRLITPTTAAGSGSTAVRTYFVMLGCYGFNFFP